MILLKHKEKNLEKVHSTFSKFIQDYWKNDSPNTQHSRAQDTVKFLNWVLSNRYNLTNFLGFEDLDFEIGADYLNSYGLDVSKKTVQKAKTTLTYFYYYLAKNRVLKNISLDIFEGKTIEVGSNVKLPNILSPFKNIRYPSYKYSNIIHSLPKPLLQLLFEVSEKHTPDITLALALGMFGGIRMGGLLNLNKSAIQPLGTSLDEGFIVSVRQRDLRKEIDRIKSKGKPKRERNQIIDISLADMILGEYKLNLIC